MGKGKRAWMWMMVLIFILFSLISSSVLGQIAGYVTDASTGVGINGAAVSLTCPDWAPTSLTTLSDGSYIQMFYEGICSISATKTGYVPSSIITIDTTQTNRADINLIRTKCTIEGYVRTSEGTAVSGALIISGSNFDYTDNSGFYQITNVPSNNDLTPLNYIFTFSKLGFVSQTQTISCTAGQTTDSNWIVAATPPPCTPTTEICDNIDNDCVGGIDNGCDDDNDNYCDSDMTYVSYTPTAAELAANANLCNAGGDCNDANQYINTGTANSYCGCPSDVRAETCDGIDDNCDGIADNGAACPLDQSCIGGICVSCSLNSECTNPPNPLCYNSQGTCSGGACSYTAQPSGTSCGTNKVCDAGGNCICAVGYTDCIGNCYDLQTDPNNCGSCGNICAAGESCVSGACTAAPPQPCTLTSASWSATQVSDKTPVTLSVSGQNCDGKTVTFDIWEDDTPSILDWFGDLLDDEVIEDPFSVPALTFTGNTAQISWTALYKTHDLSGSETEIGQPEYYFKAKLADGTEAFSDNILSVTGNLPPTAAVPFLIEPNGGEKYDQSANVLWNPATDPDDDALEYKIEYSADSGNTWSTIENSYGHKKTVEYNGAEEESLVFDFG